MKGASKQSERIPLQEACQRLRMSREQVMPRLQRGDLDGGKDQLSGHWYVTLESIERYLNAESTAADPASA